MFFQMLEEFIDLQGHTALQGLPFQSPRFISRLTANISGQLKVGHAISILSLLSAPNVL